MTTMREILEGEERRVQEAVSASVQVGEAFITYKQDGDRVDYAIWSRVQPYFGEVPAKGAIYVHTRGRTPDSVEELLDRQKTQYRQRSYLMGFQGKEDRYPYTKGRYNGETLAEIKKMGGDTVQLRTGDSVPVGEQAPGPIGGLLNELGGQTFGRRGRGRDPYWITAKYAGKDAKGTPFKKGERVFYYPNDRSILAGKNAEQAAAEFQAAADDERTYNYGFEDIDDAELLWRLGDMTEEEAEEFAAELDEKLSPEQRQAKKWYKGTDYGSPGREQMQAAKAHAGVASDLKRQSTKKLLSIVRPQKDGVKLPDVIRRAAMEVLKKRIAKSQKSGKLMLRKR